MPVDFEWYQEMLNRLAEGLNKKSAKQDISDFLPNQPDFFTQIHITSDKNKNLEDLANNLDFNFYNFEPTKLLFKSKIKYKAVTKKIEKLAELFGKENAIPETPNFFFKILNNNGPTPNNSKTNSSPVLSETFNLFGCPPINLNELPVTSFFADILNKIQNNNQQSEEPKQSESEVKNPYLTEYEIFIQANNDYSDENHLETPAQINNLEQEPIMIHPNQIEELLTDDIGDGLGSMGIWTEFVTDNLAEQKLIEDALKAISSMAEDQSNKRTNNRIKDYERADVPPFSERIKVIKPMLDNLPRKPKTEMVYFVMYDITHDGLRKRIADYLFEKGLKRLQKSVFIGQTNRRTFEQIYNTLKDIQAKYDNHDSIVMAPLSEDSLARLTMIGREENIDVFLGRQHTVFV